MHPRGPRDAKETLNSIQEASEERPRGTQERPNGAQERPKGAQKRPRALQNEALELPDDFSEDFLATFFS